MDEAGQVFSLDGRLVGPGHPPLVVAEMSGNHNGSLERALAIVEAVAASGAHALKLQTYTADTMTLDVARGEFIISDPESPWRGQSLHALYRTAHTPWEWHAPIFERCRSLGLAAFSTPFDPTAVDLLEGLGVGLYKVASFELTHAPLLERLSRTGKPVVLSTGMATAEEIGEALGILDRGGCPQVVLLRCTSSYPAPPEDAGLSTMADMRGRFGRPVGLSDHTLGIGVSVAAAALGAVLIERHVTLRRSDGGVDAAFSLEPGELALLAAESARAWAAGRGAPRYGPAESERPFLKHRRSCYVAEDLKAGEALTGRSLRVVRPAAGLPPRHYRELLGRRVRRDAPKGTPVTWDLLE